MGTFRDFDAARAEADREPLRFRLGGRLFTTKGILPAAPLLELARKGQAEGIEAFTAFADFLEAVVVETDDLKQVMREVEWPALVEVVNWVISEATARPFESPSPSPESPSVNGERSRLDWIPVTNEAPSP